MKPCLTRLNTRFTIRHNLQFMNEVKKPTVKSGFFYLL